MQHDRHWGHADPGPAMLVWTRCSYARPPHNKNGVLRPVSWWSASPRSPAQAIQNNLKSHLKLCGFKPETFTSSNQDRSSWRHDCKEGIVEFEKARIAAQVEKRYHRKQAVRTTTTSTNLQNVCNRCSRVRGSRIGFHSHQRRYTHTWWRDPSIDGSFHIIGDGWPLLRCAAYC